MNVYFICIADNLFYSLRTIQGKCWHLPWISSFLWRGKCNTSICSLDLYTTGPRQKQVREMPICASTTLQVKETLHCNKQKNPQNPQLLLECFWFRWFTEYLKCISTSTALNFREAIGRKANKICKNEGIVPKALGYIWS